MKRSPEVQAVMIADRLIIVVEGGMWIKNQF